MGNKIVLGKAIPQMDYILSKMSRYEHIKNLSINQKVCEGHISNQPELKSNSAQLLLPVMQAPYQS